MSDLAVLKALVADLHRPIDAARGLVAQSANSTLPMGIGKHSREEVLNCVRAEYGKGIVSAVSRELTELMALESAGIRVAEYLARIPDMKLLQAQLHRAVERARERATQSLLADATQMNATKQGET